MSRWSTRHVYGPHGESRTPAIWFRRPDARIRWRGVVCLSYHTSLIASILAVALDVTTDELGDQVLVEPDRLPASSHQTLDCVVLGRRVVVTLVMPRRVLHKIMLVVLDDLLTLNAASFVLPSDDSLFDDLCHEVNLPES